jgi:hypothetical protein
LRAGAFLLFHGVCGADTAGSRDSVA